MPKICDTCGKEYEKGGTWNCQGCIDDFEKKKETWRYWSLIREAQNDFFKLIKWNWSLVPIVPDLRR